MGWTAGVIDKWQSASNYETVHPRQFGRGAWRVVPGKHDTAIRNRVVQFPILGI